MKVVTLVSSSSFLWFLTVLALPNFCLSNENSNHGLCIESERLALLEFKDSLIDGANRLSSWVGEDEDCCQWAGIVCNNITGHVHELLLRGPDDNDAEYEEASRQMLGGKISSSLLYLKQLKYLDLSCNDFGGIQIPSFIGSLGNLVYLNLSKSQFGGEIPHQLGNLSMLRVLDLKYDPTSVKNLQWLSNLSLLHHLDMTRVDLSNALNWLQVINTLPSLLELHLSESGLSHIPLHLTSVNFTSLAVLDLSYNFFDTSLIPGWIFSLRKLVSLDLTRCLFHGLTPSSGGGFRNMTSLKTLHVSENDFMNSSSVLKGLFSLSTLVSLDISLCSLSSPILGGLQNMSSLARLDLSINQLNEGIPKSLGKLSFLDLSSNQFSGSISELLISFSECKTPKLEFLALRENKLSGHLPDQVGQLKNLVILELGYNSISGPIPDSIGRLSSLKELKLNVNFISGPIPDSIGRLSSLEWLDLSFNQFNGSLPKSLGQLEKLNFVSIYHNLLSGVVTEEHFANLKALKTLRAEGNKLTLELRANNWVPPFQLNVLRIGSWNLGPHFPSWLQLQRNLTELNIADAGISDIMPIWFWSTFSGLLYLNISHNKIQGNLIGDLSILAPSAVLDLSANCFGGPLPGHFNRPDIFLLDLSNNYLSGSLEKFLCPTNRELRQLKVLNLVNNNLSGAIPNCWMKWQSLSFVSFENNNLTGGIPQSVGQLSSLESLNLRNNKLSGKLPASLLNSKSLLIIELAENGFVGNLPKSIGSEVTSLKVLSLRSNKLEGDIPEELCRLNSIQILDLADNNLSGNIPTCFYNFSIMSGKENSGKENPSQIVLYDEPFQTQFLGSASLVTKGREFSYSSILNLVTTLDLSSNNFSGHIPNELVTLLGLHWMNLSGNYLTGRIPEKIGEMRSLESLDVSVNQLDGEIPLSMSNLNFLSWLNLSYNNLTGRIPSGAQLQSLHESSFIGNKLCGAPLTVVCDTEKRGAVPDFEKGGKKDGTSHGMDWGLIISIVLGFIVGFWVVVGPLTVSRLWRIVYFHFMDKMRQKLNDVIRKYCCNIFS